MSQCFAAKSVRLTEPTPASHQQGGSGVFLRSIPISVFRLAKMTPDVRVANETAVAEPLRKADLFAPSGQPAPLAMEAPAQEELTTVATADPAIQAPPAQIESSQAEKPVVERKGVAKTAARTPAKPPVTAERTPPQRTRTVKASTRDAWGVMRRFDERPRIPVDAYSADGAPRRIIIRPTSIQDVYYYNSR